MFPFHYEGKKYYECTTEDNGNIYWCGTTFFVTDTGWGLCTSSCMSAPGK